MASTDGILTFPGLHCAPPWGMSPRKTWLADGERALDYNLQSLGSLSRLMETLANNYQAQLSHYGLFMLPQIFVSLLPSLLSSSSNADDKFRSAIVIDTLRFTTTACQALLVGANSLRVASSVEAARQLADSLSPRPVLCGERHCHPIDGFDLGNSPLDYVPASVQDRSLIFTTTNGTLAVAAAEHMRLPSILLAGLVNRRAVCRHLQQQSSPDDLLIVCAGTDGQVALEDVLTAGAIVADLIAAQRFACGNDSALLALAAWQELDVAQVGGSTALQHQLSLAVGGKNLLEAGYAADVKFAANLDSLDIVPAAVHSQHAESVFKRA